MARAFSMAATAAATAAVTAATVAAAVTTAHENRATYPDSSPPGNIRYLGYMGEKVPNIIVKLQLLVPVPVFVTYLLTYFLLTYMLTPCRGMRCLHS